MNNNVLNFPSTALMVISSLVTDTETSQLADLKLLVGDETPSLNQAHVTEQREPIHKKMLKTETVMLCVNDFSVSLLCFEPVDNSFDLFKR